jgi:hypothetical protein
MTFFLLLLIALAGCAWMEFWLWQFGLGLDTPRWWRAPGISLTTACVPAVVGIALILA